MVTIPEHRLTRCRECGCRVMFVTTNEGKKVPLDPVAPVFHRIKDPDSGNFFWWKEAHDSAFVSHFATCRGRS